VLKNDKRAIFTAASHAQRAVDFLHQLQEPQAASEATKKPRACRRAALLKARML
jgi:antirestriction protein ArdC